MDELNDIDIECIMQDCKAVCNKRRSGNFIATPTFKMAMILRRSIYAGRAALSAVVGVEVGVVVHPQKSFIMSKVWSIVLT